MLQLTVNQIKQIALPILKEAGVKRSSLFGSYARGDNQENSDIDILVEFPMGKTLFDLVDLEENLKQALQKDVDVVTYKSVSFHVEKYISTNQIVLL